MIVVDTNVLAYLYLPTDMTPQAVKLREVHPHWIAPRLWRSELRSVLALHLRKGLLEFEQALRLQARAEALMADCEFDIPSQDILRLVQESRCSAYDCEFVALAKRFNSNLVTSDQKVIRAFPNIAVSLVDAGA